VLEYQRALSKFSGNAGAQAEVDRQIGQVGVFSLRQLGVDELVENGFQRLDGRGTEAPANVCGMQQFDFAVLVSLENVGSAFAAGRKLFRIGRSCTFQHLEQQPCDFSAFLGPNERVYLAQIEGRQRLLHGPIAVLAYPGHGVKIGLHRRARRCQAVGDRWRWLSLLDGRGRRCRWCGGDLSGRRRAEQNNQQGAQQTHEICFVR